MQVLFQNRKDAFDRWGGDTTQMVETKNNLELLGIKVDVSLDISPDLSGYDLVHVFNVQTDEGYHQVKHASRQGIPVALSTIYWDMRHVDRMLFQTFPTYHHLFPLRLLGSIDWRLAYVAKKILTLNHNRRRYHEIREMVMKADILLPNSIAELEIISLLFNAPWARAKAAIVPNACLLNDKDEDVDATFLSNTTKFQVKDNFVLEVGRIEPLKGQLNVIKALSQHLDIPLVFIGRGLDSEYGKACVKEGEKRGNTWFIGEIKHTEIKGFYEHAKVHVLPSLRESPGLTTLEAAVYGANCVVSYYGPVIEYFDNDVWYCEPLDSNSIQKAILSAWNSPTNDNLRNRILTEFTWAKAANKTYQAYQRVGLSL